MAAQQGKKGALWRSTAHSALQWRSAAATRGASSASSCNDRAGRRCPPPPLLCILSLSTPARRAGPHWDLWQWCFVNREVVDDKGRRGVVLMRPVHAGLLESPRPEERFEV